MSNVAKLFTDKANEAKHQVTIKLSDEIYTRLGQVCQANKVSRNDLVSAAIADALDSLPRLCDVTVE